MSWLLIAIGYLALHLLAYIAVLRHLRSFSRETTIFLYHFVSATLLSICALLVWLLRQPPNGFALAASVILLHAIYSLSFLELWSLAEGGYSLGILRYLATAAAHDRPVSPDSLATIGSSKKHGRLAGLERLGLIRNDAGEWRLTGTGQLAVSFFSAIARAVNMQQAA